MDRVKVWPAKDGWRWFRYDAENGREVSESGEGYDSRAHAVLMAKGLNQDAEVFVVDAKDDPPGEAA